MVAAAKTRLLAEDIKPDIDSPILNGKEEPPSCELARDIRALIERRGVPVSRTLAAS